MKRLALLLVLACFSIAPSFAQDLRSEDIVIQNTVANDPIREKAEQKVLADALVPPQHFSATQVAGYPAADPPPVLGPTKADELLDVQHIVQEKEKKRAVMKEYNRKMDLAYKTIPNKPNYLHFMKRMDLWTDYHQDRQRKFRTRDLPNAQMGGTILGTIFSAVAAFH